MSAPEDRVTLWRWRFRDVGDGDGPGDWSEWGPDVLALHVDKTIEIRPAEFVREGVEAAATVEAIVAALKADAAINGQLDEVKWSSLRTARFVESRFGGGA